MANGAQHDLGVRVGFASETGKRAANEDYVAACLGQPGALHRDVVAAVADGVGGHKGGREAAEVAVRSFIDAYYSLPETLGVRRRAARALEAANSWIYGQGRVDAARSGMACAFSSIILSRRQCHVIHIGDTRAYRLSDGRLERLTQDHIAGRGDLAHMLSRAIGFEEFARFDYTSVGLRQHDRLVICSDGVHGALSDSRLQQLLEERTPPDESARSIVDAALAAGSSDNTTALVLDVVDLPPADRDDLTDAIATLPILDLPESGDTIDDFALHDVLSDGRYSRLFKATDKRAGREVVLKFPHPRVASEGSYRLAFVREAWVAARVRSLWIGEIIEVPAERQTRLYSAMPLYEGETLEQRLNHAPRLSLTEGIAIATKLVRAVTALHRAGIIHRDIKPDNVILLKDGGLRLVDLGVARVPLLEDFPAEDIPGTASYMAPELFGGKAGDEASDLFALGVTVYRMFTANYPFGEIEPFSRPRFGKPAPLSRYRPDLPAWLDAVIGKALSVEPAQRFGDAIEFAHELENGATWAGPAVTTRKSLHDRDPVTFWKVLCAILALIIVVLLARH
ncbi:bifunctional protein-serine/threonine kinase/phosphatase [Bradyrhizobium sp. RD5-C2]|uniref:bifunctional protein-serine/threonine kinase/phosphatase n=1 Tax=Bradyrhizobium sp. RD5-C2 TaxID=244562 RepID=UPI001CC5635F|nr:bifunctional protein-serine/threonine kinase/phosphatase [Bradyrhizobium sp. RD5-C2]GIQ71748.1 protein kinase [Bradyrhizobium sp. RD5-C2]